MEYWMATTGDGKEKGINGGLSKKGESGMPNMNTIGVSNVDDFSKKVENSGGKILQPKMPYPASAFLRPARTPKATSLA